MSHPHSLPDLVHWPRPEAWVKAALVGLVAALTLAAVALLRAFTRFLHRRRVLAPIPEAPGSNALLGHALPLLFAPKSGMGAWDLMHRWTQLRGPIVRFRLLFNHGVIVADPLALKRIFQQRFKIYAKDLGMSYHPFLPILGSGLVTADGELWQKQRLLIGPALRVDILDSIVGIAKRATDRLSAKLERYRGSGQALSIEEEFRLLTLQVIGEAILSLPPEECDRVFPQLYLPVMEESNQRVLRPWRKYLPLPAWFAYRRRMAQLNGYLLDVIRTRWQRRQQGVKEGEDGRPSDILDRILEAIESAGTKWSAALETQLCYEIKTFLLAGHETSAAMLTWSVYELTQNPEATAKVRDEAQAVFGETEAEPPRKAVDDMAYTLSVLKEALRRYTVVPVVTRNLIEDDELLGHPVPAGTMIVVSLQSVHKQWSAPEVFRPERFMPGGEYDSFDEAVRPYMFVPFIQGPRNCLGQHLALLEARVVLALLLKRFTFTPASAAKPQCHPEVIPVASVCGMDMYVS